MLGKPLGSFFEIKIKLSGQRFTWTKKKKSFSKTVKIINADWDFLNEIYDLLWKKNTYVVVGFGRGVTNMLLINSLSDIRNLFH